jgi:hypothetical protein
MRSSFSTVRFAGCVMIATQLVGAQEAKKGDSWENLTRVRHSPPYTFVDRERNCVVGGIVSVTDRDIAVERWGLTATRPPIIVTMGRSSLLRVTDGWHSYDIVYSGRSSWSDVRGLQGIPGGEHVLLITKDAKRHKGRLADVSETHAKLMQGNKTVEITKDDVSRVYCFRYKPASASAIYNAQEMNFLDPELWPYMLHIAPKIPVLLYDSSMPEDNDPVVCKNNPWGVAPIRTQ